MNKAKLLLKQEKLRKQLEELEKNIEKAEEEEKEDQGSSLLPVVKGNGENSEWVKGYHFRPIGDKDDGDDRLVAVYGDSFYVESQQTLSPLVFQSHTTCENYAKAFETFLLLRQQKGSVPAMVGRDGYVVWCNRLVVDDSGDDIYTMRVIPIYQGSHNALSPCFSSMEAAQNAVNNIGQKRLAHMFKMFHSR